MRAAYAITGIFAGLALVGCTSAYSTPPIMVTRFVNPQSAPLPAQGVFFIEPESMRPAHANAPASLYELAPFKAALAAELTRLGYREGARADANVIAHITVQTAVRSLEPSGRNPVNVGVGGSVGSYGSGIGVGIGINLNELGKQRARNFADHFVRVTLNHVRTGQPFWEARAEHTESDPMPENSDKSRAARVMHALFKNYPGTNGETVTVKE